MKKSLMVLLGWIILLNICISTTYASEQEKPILISIDNRILTLEQEPIIINNRTLVPVRFVSEELAYQVKWDNENRNIYIYNKDVVPKVYNNNTEDIQVFINNNIIEFPDQKPLIVNERTFIPLRAVAENMNVSVTWNSELNLVNIKTVDDNSNINTNIQEPILNNGTDIFEGYTIIEVDGGDLSGNRKPNVVVDIGFGDREYYAFTNEYGQLVKVIADKIILQDDENEPVLSTGRYYSDEAKVSGTELSNYDEGHIIADSLGGVANAYNITPQESTLNRYGDQAYMEKSIREANGATNFLAIITYPNNQTQIPSHYSYTYTLMGNIIVDEFENINPDEVNKKLENSNSSVSNSNNISITALDKKKEVITIRNNTNKDIDLTDWVIVSVRGNQKFRFSQYTLKANSSIKIGDSKNNDVTFHWLEGKGTWHNTESDPAELYDNLNNLIYRFND